MLRQNCESSTPVNSLFQMSFRVCIAVFLFITILTDISSGFILRHATPSVNGLVKTRRKHRFRRDTEAIAILPSRASRTSLDAASMSSNNGHFGQKNFSTKTARDSAVIAEWEPVSELQQRIEDCINYEHWSLDSMEGVASNPGIHQSLNEEEIHRCQGVFCGIKVSPDERKRLKSANLND